MRCAAHDALVARHQLLESWRRSSAIGSGPRDRQSESKNRAMIELAGYADGAAVSFHDGFRNRQSHSSSLNDRALVFAAIEFVEDEALLHSFDTGAVIGDAEQYEISIVFRADNDGLVFFRIQIGIFKKVHRSEEHTSEL